MSICRWSSDNFQCDLYVWEDYMGGYCSEVAGRRHVFKVPLPRRADLPIGEVGSPEREAWVDEWLRSEREFRALLDDETTWEWVELPTPTGGTSYWHETAGECADNLERLVAEGFNVPQEAIHALRRVDCDD